MARFITTALLCLVLIAIGDANLMGVDLGLSYIKVSVARPGKGLELVTNEQSKRKTPAAVGFTIEGERLFGDAAVAYAAKAPARAILDGRSLIGRCASDDSSSNPDHSAFCKHDRLTLEGIGSFSGEEIIAMQLEMARRQASTALGGAQIKDVAITVPAWYDERQRQAVADAARIIGLNCLGVVNANTAAAIKYALDGKARPSEEDIAAEKAKDKKKRAPKTITQRVMFYDLGAGGASASIAEVTTDVKTGIASSVNMLSHAWEKGVGGRHLDEVIVERLADAFDKQRGEGATPSRDIPRVMMRLKKEAQRVREVLSANTDTMVSVASLYDDLDLRTSMKREDFEKDAEPMLSLVGGPIKAALAKAKLKAEDLDAIVPFGGTSRTPRVQQELLKTLGVQALNKSINTDEAAVVGSAFFGALMSSTFRVRKMDVEDVYGRSISAEIEKEGSSGGLFSGKVQKATQKVEIFPEGVGRMPSKKTLSLNRNNDFNLDVFLGMDSSGLSRYSERTLYAKIAVKGVTDVLKKLKDSSKAKKLTPRVALTFHIDRSGLIRIGTAESSVDETVVVEREVEVKEAKENKTEGKSKDEKDGKEGAGTEVPDEKSSDAPTSDDASDKEESPKASPDNTDGAKNDKKKEKKTRIEKSTQTIVHRHSLTIEYLEGEGIYGAQLSKAELEASQKALKDLEKADLERVERADALNALEGFILEIRSKVRGVDEDDDLYQVSTEEERNSIVTAFDEAEDWMYTDDAKQTANLRKKHFELRKLYEPIANREKELTGRSAAFKALMEGLDMALEKIDPLKQLHIERESKHIDEFDKFKSFCKAMKSWITEKEEAQSKKPLTEEPVVAIKDIMAKGDELRKEVERIVKLDLPPPPKAKETKEPETKENISEGTEGSTNATADGSAADDEVLGEGDLPTEPDSGAAQAGAASGASMKDEL